MFLFKLSLTNFKNYCDHSFEFISKINCITGNNGVGKTNLLDAIYYLSFCKSYFNAVDSQNIMFDKDFFVINGEFITNGTVENILCSMKRNGRKQFKRNQKEYQALSEHIGLLPLVMVSPYDGELVIGGSAERRRFIDSVISQYDKDYLHYLIYYNKALAQRNILLKDFNRNHSFDANMLELWNMQLIKPGKEIHKKRIEFINSFIPVFAEYYKSISGENETASVEYTSELTNTSFENLLSASIEKDRILEHTTKGIHKDDLELKIEGHSLKRTGSQGQQKSFLLALKFAQFEFLTKTVKIKPIMLLDDIFDKLDEQRVSNIVKLVSHDTFGQIFITDTSRNRLEKIMKQMPIEHQFITIE